MEVSHQLQNGVDVCGLGGLLGARSDVVANQLTAALQHRGPDGSSRYASEIVDLVHTRLAIVDVAGGEQPFTSDEGRYKIFYNGEIYNHAALRHQFAIEASRVDGAILPALWEVLGVRAFDHLRGMYSICVHDTNTGETWLAVDPLGLKSLYVADSPKGTVFASELTPVANVGGRYTIQQGAKKIYDRYGCLPARSSGVVGIERFIPGEYRRFDKSGHEIERGRISTAGWRTADPTGWDDVVAAFIGSVEAHLMSDVPIALMLSSGVDSSAIAWAAAELGQRLDCFTLDFENSHREGTAAAELAKSFGHRHTRHLEAPSPRDLADFLLSVDRPTPDGLNTFLVCRAAARDGFKVLLSGIGADELLLGYGHHRRRVTNFPGLDRSVRAMCTAASSALARRSAPHVGPDVNEGLPLGSGLTRGLRSVARVGLPPTRDALVRRYRSQVPDAQDDMTVFDAPDFAALAGGRVRGAIAIAEWRYYLGPTLLADTDVYSMANSIEVRSPYVDLGFMASVFALHDSQRGKQAFCRATGNHILAERADNTKMGFTLPIAQWLRDPQFAGLLKHALGQRLDPAHMPFPDSRPLQNWKELVFATWSARLANSAPTSTETNNAT